MLMDMTSETYESAMHIPMSRRIRLLEKRIEWEKERSKSNAGMFSAMAASMTAPRQRRR